MKRFYSTILSIFFWFLLPVQPCPAGLPSGVLKAFVCIPPQAFFVRQVAGDRVEVSILVGPGQSPHSYEPTPKETAELIKADIYFKIGLPFEERLLKKTADISSGLRIVDTRQGIRMRPPDGHDDDEPGGADPHIWLSPPLIALQAEVICNALCGLDPAHAGEFRKNLMQFTTKLSGLDADIQKKLAPFRGRELFVFHPSFGYFTDTYGLVQVSIETDGKEPGPRSLASVMDRARKSGAKVIFAERQFSPKSARAVARGIGAEVVTLDPLAQDCFQNLSDIARRFAEALNR